MILSLLAACTGPETDGNDTSGTTGDTEIQDTCPHDAGTVCTYVGNGTAAFDGDGNHRLASMLYWPLDIEVSDLGDPMIVDWNNHKVRAIQSDDTLKTVVGTNFLGDGPDDQSDLEEPGALGTTVHLNHPTDVKYLADGTLMMAHWHNHKFRSYDPSTGYVMVWMGAGVGYAGDGGTRAEALMAMPKGFDYDEEGNLYFVDQKNERIRAVYTDDTVATVGGNGTKGYAGDDGVATDANIAQPNSAQPEPGGGIAYADGVLYFADTENNRVRAIDLELNTIWTVAGDGTAGYGGDGGDAAAAQVNLPRDVEVADGVLYIADTDNHVIRAVDLETNVISTVAGTGAEGFSGDEGPATEATFDRPFGIGVASDGALYIADTYNHRIRVVYP